MTTTAETVKATVSGEGRRKKTKDVEDNEDEASEAGAGVTQNAARENDRERQLFARSCLDLRKRVRPRTRAQNSALTRCD